MVSAVRCEHGAHYQGRQQGGESMSRLRGMVGLRLVAAHRAGKVLVCNVQRCRAAKIGVDERCPQCSRVRVACQWLPCFYCLSRGDQIVRIGHDLPHAAWTVIRCLTATRVASRFNHCIADEAFKTLCIKAAD